MELIDRVLDFILERIIPSIFSVMLLAAGNWYLCHLFHLGTAELALIHSDLGGWLITYGPITALLIMIDIGCVVYMLRHYQATVSRVYTRLLSRFPRMYHEHC